VARETVTKVKITEPITLEDLRWLVEQCSEFYPECSVEITSHKSYSPIDWDPATITVNGRRLES
jgi:hypothetical protein